MACDLCGKKCQGKLCSFCERAEARDGDWAAYFKDRDYEDDSS